MTAPDIRAAPHSFGTSVTSVVSALLLAVGVGALAAALKEPVGAGLIYVVNFLLKNKHADVLPLAAPVFSWILQLGYFTIGLVIVVVAVRIAFWQNQRSSGIPQTGANN